MVDKELLEILACPICKGDLEYINSDTEGLYCKNCKKLYPIKENIPIMLEEEAIDYDYE